MAKAADLVDWVIQDAEYHTHTTWSGGAHTHNVEPHTVETRIDMDRLRQNLEEVREFLTYIDTMAPELVTAWDAKVRLEGKQHGNNTI